MTARITAPGHNIQVFRSLRHRDFRWFWFSSTALASAQGMQFLILGWLVLELTTDSSTKLGLMIFMYGVPNLVLIVFGGVVADRIDRVRLLAVAQAGVTILILVIATLRVAGMAEMWHIYLIAFGLGALQALTMPAIMAIVADLVHRDDMMNAVALASVTQGTGRMIGPAVAGGFIELTGTGPALYFNAGWYVLGIVCLGQIKGGSQTRPIRTSPMLRDLVAGWRYARSMPAVFVIVMGLGPFSIFAFQYLQVMPAFAKEVLDVGAAGSGLLLLAAGIGALVGNLALASLGDFRHKSRLLITVTLVFCFTLFLFAWSPWYWASWGILLIIGMASMCCMSVSTTLLQLIVPEEMRGRVMGLWSVGTALFFIGALPIGVVADAFGWPVAITGGAALFLAFTLRQFVWSPTIRNLKM